MAFPIIPCGMFSGQGSTVRPNADANGTITGILNGKITNRPYAYDTDPNTYAEMKNSGPNAFNAAAAQEILYTHSPATGLNASSFVNLVVSFRANAYFTKSIGGAWCDTSLLLTVSGNYSDTTPIQSSANPYAVISATAATINAATTSQGAYSLGFTGNAQITFDQFAPLTIDLYSLSISIKWSFAGNGSGNNFSNSIFDARIYDISYIYL